MHSEETVDMDSLENPFADPPAPEREADDGAGIGSSPDWLGEVDRIESETLDFPSITRREPAEKVDMPRVRHLFPVPDETEWDVAELEYDRTKASLNR